MAPNRRLESECHDRTQAAKDAKKTQCFSAAFAAFAFHGGVSYSDILLEQPSERQRVTAVAKTVRDINSQSALPARNTNPDTGTEIHVEQRLVGGRPRGPGDIAEQRKSDPRQLRSIQPPSRFNGSRHQRTTERRVAAGIDNAAGEQRMGAEKRTSHTALTGAAPERKWRGVGGLLETGHSTVLPPLGRRGRAKLHTSGQR